MTSSQNPEPPNPYAASNEGSGATRVSDPLPPPEISSRALDSARTKAYLRLMPILFICYIIAYVDRNNVAIAKLTMTQDLAAKITEPGDSNLEKGTVIERDALREVNERLTNEGKQPAKVEDLFDNSVIGFGAGVFFWGYFLLEIPGTLIVERWSARKWICRIMVTWGILAALTAFVRTPTHFYIIRFLLGLAEAGFFPGVIVYLTHWFPARDRGRAISIFLVASPIAMILGPALSRLLLPIGTTQVIDGVTQVVPAIGGLNGWQWIYIAWGIPAVVMGVVVLLALTDRPGMARWLSTEERTSLESQLAYEKSHLQRAAHMTVAQALSNPKVILLSLAYFGIVTANYGIEIFLPSILKDWYSLSLDQVTWLAMLPSVLVIAGQLGVGWSSDHFQERRWHASLPVVIGAVALVLAPWTQGHLWLTIACFMIAATGMKSYMPAFWALPSLFLTASAAAGSVGLINSVGNLGGFLGPTVVGKVESSTGSFAYGLYFLALTSTISACIIAAMKIRRPERP